MVVWLARVAQLVEHLHKLEATVCEKFDVGLSPASHPIVLTHDARGRRFKSSPECQTKLNPKLIRVLYEAYKFMSKGSGGSTRVIHPFSFRTRKLRLVVPMVVSVTGGESR